jgi:hypothetical protein
MNIAIVGSREFSDYSFLKEKMESICDSTTVTRIISGGAKGADSLAAAWANEKGLALLELRPDWQKHGKSAGFRRNSQIIEKADMCVAFWDGVSRGTAHSISLAKAKGIRVLVYCPSCK